MIVAIKLMPDYACYPLWWEGENRVGNIDPETLPLSQETIKRLHGWSEAYDATLNWNDPADSPGFLNHNDQEAFEHEGIELWKQLQKELPSHFKVYYFSDRLKKLVSSSEELENQIYQRPYVFEGSNVIHFYDNFSSKEVPANAIEEGPQIFDKDGKVIAVKRSKLDLERGTSELISV